MYITEVVKDIWQISENLPCTIYFEGIWPIPKGVSVNQFLLKTNKGVVLIDGLIGWDGTEKGLDDILEKANVSFKDLKYLIINHMEPDHSAWLEPLLKICPNVEIYISQKGAGILKALFGRENVNMVKDGDSLDLESHKLSFHLNPNIHWPDTMLTFEENTKTLFSCDGFGTYGEVKAENYDDHLTEEDLLFYEDEAFGYYSNVMAICTRPIENSVAKARELGVKIIAPGHGPVWRKNPERIMKLYEELAKCQTGSARKEITLIWGSMYGFTEMGVKRAIETLEKSGITYHVYRVPEDETGLILKACWKSQAIILAMPTYEYNMFPPMSCLLDELGKKRVFGRKAFRFGSYGWSGGAEKELQEIMENRKMQWEFLPTVEFNGRPTESDLNVIEERVKELIHNLE